EAADFPIGVALSYTPTMTDTRYLEIVKRDFDETVFEYHMKHGAIVQDNGSFNFTRTDEMVNAVGSNALFGHVLAWHSNQNATYLKNFAGIVVPAATELLSNPGFESGLASWSTFNSGNPSGSATITTGSGSNEVRTGTGAMKVINPTAYPGNQWRVQVAGPLVPTVPGQQYTFNYWVKAAAGGGSIRLSTATNAGGSPQYQGDQTIGTAWQQINWTITANSTETRVLFDMGQAANTYYIDDASFKEVVATPNPGQIGEKLDQALKTFIQTMVNRYKTKVRAWDVVNEVFADGGGTIRNNNNTSTTPSDVLVWSHYMGRDFAFKAFKYAQEADPTADLYINDYNLESNNAKLDSTIAYVAELKAKGAKIDGIGTQMHINWNTSRAGIDNMFKKLAATGLKVRVSELDVRTVLNSAAGFLTPQLAGYQAAMYEYVVTSYLKHVPPAQRAGITVWGVVDKYSWLSNSGKEFPLLYDDNYTKKPAYAGFLKGLRSGK
ncbi:MAG TPA: endo-1,4-beta-xylanase, partial [Phnomibacter sp.]|nr:endo-1,4-beta-xylanase [Phnomibacter sp.]